MIRNVSIQNGTEGPHWGPYSYTEVSLETTRDSRKPAIKVTVLIWD